MGWVALKLLVQLVKFDQCSCGVIAEVIMHHAMAMRCESTAGPHVLTRAPADETGFGIECITFALSAKLGCRFASPLTVSVGCILNVNFATIDNNNSLIAQLPPVMGE